MVVDSCMARPFSGDVGERRHLDFESVGEEVDWLVACVGGECIDFAEFEFDGAVDASAGHVDDWCQTSATLATGIF